MSPQPALVLEGSRHLLLGRGCAWRVESGLVAVFYSALESDRPTGPREYLFDAAPGDVLEGVSESGRGWIAVAIRESRLAACPPAGEGGWHRRMRASLAVHLGEGDSEADYLHAAATMAAAREQSHQERFHSRRALNRRMAHGSLQELVEAGGGTVSQTAEAPPEGSISRLTLAVRAIGEAQGFTVQEPALESARRDPVAALAMASGVRCRRVSLVGRWWTAEHGPILAFLSESQSPVALLPTAAGIFRGVGYTLYNPADGSRRPAGRAAAASLDRAAFVFYPPLPEDTRTWSLLRFAIRPFRRDLWMVGAAGAGATLLAMAIPAAMSILFSQAIPDADRSLLIQVALGLAASLAGTALFEIAQSLALLRLQTGVAARLQTGVQDRLLRLSPSFFRRHTAGDLHSRADAVTQIQQLLDPSRVRMALSGIISSFNLALMLFYSVPLAMASLGCALVMLLAMASGGRAVVRMERALRQTAGALSGLMIQLINAAGKLRVAGAEPRAYAQWARSYAASQTLERDIRAVKDNIRLTGAAMPLLATALSFWLALAQADGAPRIGLGAFLGFLVAQGVFLGAVAGLSDSCTGLLAIGTLWSRSREILQAQPEAAPGRIHPGQLQGRIAVEHVSFRYRPDGPATLEDVSFHAEPGECIALVGPSGSGKSTILNLMLRFEAPASGAIYLDGRDIASLDVAAMRRQLGVVSQESKLMAQSIYENIICGGVGSMEEAWEAVRMAGIDEDIEQMPMGMHTLVSEDGANLSGGQRQRLLIARALMRKPKVFLFDEATSALDNRTQRIVTESMNRLKATRIVVAHRLSTIRNADRIYVIDAGRIVQQGSFEELAAQPGLFASLMRRQFAGMPDVAAGPANG